MPSPSASPQLRQRGGGQSKKSPAAAVTDASSETLDDLVQSAKKTVRSEWDYKLALAVITFLAFATRFYGLSHPNEVVFDEVHFGKVCSKIVLTNIFIEY